MSRLPGRAEIFPVFACLVFFDFSWALYRMFWQVPSWLGYLSIWNVLILVAYVLAYALVESLAVMAFILLWCFVLPARLFKERFVAQGTSLVVAISLAAVALQRKIGIVYELDLTQLRLYPALFLAAVPLFLIVTAYLFNLQRLAFLPRWITALADRMTVFAFLYLPLALLSWGVVLLLNLF